MGTDSSFAEKIDQKNSFENQIILVNFKINCNSLLPQEQELQEKIWSSQSIPRQILEKDWDNDVANS